MANLRESADSVIKERKKWLEEATQAKKLLEQLPEEIIQLPGEVDCYMYPDGEILLKVNVRGKNSHKVLKYNGIQGLRLTALSKDYFQMMDGKGVLPDGTKVDFTASNVDLPPNCKLEPYEELVTRFKVICPEMVRV